MQTVMNLEEIRAFFAHDFPQMQKDYVIDAVTEEGLDLRLKVRPDHLRPGGTVSGPSMFGLADVAMYLALLTRIGPVALAVTVNVSMDFLRKPDGDRDVTAKARLLKVGRRLGVGDVVLFSRGKADPVARAGLTYSIPPNGQKIVG
ncbi:MAG: PaaI family thioesterase [Paracoccaceae bacterium]